MVEKLTEFNVAPGDDASIEAWQTFGRAQKKRADRLQNENRQVRGHLNRLRKEVKKKDAACEHYRSKIAQLEGSRDHESSSPWEWLMSMSRLFRGGR